jgi:tetratricopeptide (TPR) repeat protein/predicted Ser/Thr protein kinase
MSSRGERPGDELRASGGDPAEEDSPGEERGKEGGAKDLGATDADAEALDVDRGQVAAGDLDLDPDLEEADDFLSEVARVDDVMPPLPQPLAGQTLGRFRILSELGRGGMGVVYLAHDENLRRAVALKLLSPSLNRQEERYRRFLREARAAASVTHTNLATIYDVGEVEGNIFIAMERVEGTTLRRWLARGPLPLEEAAHFAAQILAGLAKAHRAGIVHRDLKPDNIMVTDDRVIKLLDFGLAKHHRVATTDAVPAGNPERLDTWPRDTAVDQLVGTPGYMSPEQVRGGAVDPRSDIFSFGVIFYEMLAGKRPFRGKSHADLQSAILRDPPAPLGSLRDDLPRGLENMVERCLEKEPDRRYPDCGAISLALSQLDLGVATRFVTPSSSMLREAAAGSSASGAPRAPTRAGRGRRRAIAALVVASAFAAVLAVERVRTPGAGSATPELVSADLSARPAAVTDLPLPQSKSPEAVAAYAAAMQGIRDGNWGYVESHLERAIDLDPGMAVAQLRLAIVLYDTPRMGLARDAFGRALLGRASLSERDQVLLNAYEPLIYRDPPDRGELARRLRAATERYPRDAEMAACLSYAVREPEEILRAARRTVELDPQYADGWQMVGQSLFKLGRTQEALSALDRCVALSPATADCRAERGLLQASEGHCAEMDDNLRRAVSSSNNGMWQDYRAAALFALGRPPEAIIEVYRNKWAQVSKSSREQMEWFDRSTLAFALGNFKEAEEQALAGMRAVESDAEAYPHARLALLLVELYGETNRPRDAGHVAREYLNRKDGWIRSATSDLHLMGMYWAMLRAKMMSREAFEDNRDAWLRNQADATGIDRLSAFQSYACGVETPDEATEVLTTFSDLKPPPMVYRNDFALTLFSELYFLTGDRQRALPGLEKTVRSCYALTAPLLYVRANYYLGRVLEADGDKAGACSAYSQVLARWGNSKPESVTASRARERSRGLHCAPSLNPGQERKPG